MEAGRLHSVVVFVAFLCVLAAYSSEGNRRLVDISTGNGVSWNIQEIDEETAKQTLIYCREELKESAEAFETLESYLHRAAKDSYYNGNSDIALLAKRIIQKAIIDLPLQEKQNLLDCLRDKSHRLHDSGKVIESKTWLSRCQELFHEWSSVPRRYLRRKGGRRRPEVNPGISAQAPSPQVLASSPSPVPQPLPPTQPPAKTPEPPLPKDPSPSVVIHPPPEQQNGAPNSAENDKKNKMLVIAATTSSAVAVLALAALFLLLCLKSKKNKEGLKDGQRDEKPLLNFCSSDISAGSSQTIGISSSKDMKTSSAVNNLSAVVDNRDQGVIHPSGASGNTNTSLPLPPEKSAPPPPAPPPPPPPKPPAPSPPPPPKVARPPPNPPKSGNLAKPSPLGPHRRGRSSIGEGSETSDSDAPKAKLKPFFWDKVLANPDHSMVWHDIKAGSFQFNEELMETLFGYAPDQGKNERRTSSSESMPQYIQIIDPKKSQNLAILLRALNVTTEEVCDALKEGNELPAELIQTLLKMAPTTEEELKLRLFSGDVSQLGPAERFLKVMVDIPFAFKRLESLLFMGTVQEEVVSIKESFASLEVACNVLRNSRLFLKLLEAVLKTGNRMNDGTYRGGAQAFKLDTLLKLSDVKGTDGKTTLLHFVVQEIIRSEGVRAARRLRENPSMSSVKTEDLIEDSSQETAEYHRSLGLEVVSGLSSELENVKKAALIDIDNLSATMSNVGHSFVKSRDFLNKEMKSLEKDCEFRDTLASFVEQLEADVTSLLEEEKRIMALVKSTGDYFHGNAGKDEGLRLFVVVRDFLLMLDKVCKEVKVSTKLPVKTPRKEALTVSPSQESRQESLLELHKRLFPSIRHRQNDDFSSDDES